MDFVAIDVETANADMASICAVGLCRFVGGAPAGSAHFLVDPQDEFDTLNIAIHGITPEMVAGKPTLADVLPVLRKHLSGSILVHHTHFDRVALGRAAQRHGHSDIDGRWLDSARVARRAWPDVAYSGYGLAPLAARFGIEFVHHDASEDARAAGLVLLHAIRETGIALEDWFTRVEQAIDQERAAQYRAKRSGNVSGHLIGETVVFTGALSMPRVEASELAANAGCDVSPSVTKATTILVVGDQDIRAVGATGKSTKHRKAEKMISEGASIKIIKESDFIDLTKAGG